MREQKNVFLGLCILVFVASVIVLYGLAPHAGLVCGKFVDVGGLCLPSCLSG